MMRVRCIFIVVIIACSIKSWGGMNLDIYSGDDGNSRESATYSGVLWLSEDAIKHFLISMVGWGSCSFTREIIYLLTRPRDYYLYCYRSSNDL